MIRLRHALAVVTLSACSSSTTDEAPLAGTLVGFPGVEDLADTPELPDVLVARDGSRVATAEEFTRKRAPELRDLLAHYVYGFAPPAAAITSVTEVARADDLLGGAVTYRELAIAFTPAGTKPIHLAIFAPANVPRPPVFLGPNKCGNHTIVADARVRTSTSFALRACETTDDAEAWPVADIVARGFALATFHESDVCPDQPDRVGEGIAPHVTPPGDPATHWGTIAQWSWGISRAIDALSADPGVDAARIALVGHSRRGKAVLWAAANDPRPALVVAHQSGTAGAALFRSPVGENVTAITTLFPHWFDATFVTFKEHERRLPFDQHALLALVAPRSLLVTDGDADVWADPPGARDAVTAADAVWKLFGSEGHVPGSRTAPLTYATRPGGHAIGRADWAIFLDYASARFGL